MNVTPFGMIYQIKGVVIGINFLIGIAGNPPEADYEY